MATQYGNKKVEVKPGSLKARRGEAEPEVKEPDPTPPENVVRQFHTNAAVDTKATDIHHTLGHQAEQASPGDHDHNGGNSKLLLEGYVLSGAKATPSMVLPSIIACLVRLGATDNTT